MKFFDTKKLDVKYENYPFPYVVIDNFINADKLKQVLFHIDQLDTNNADQKFIKPHPHQFNKYAFSKTLPPYLEELFKELSSSEFINNLEKLVGIRDLIKNDHGLRGAGIHLMKNKGFLGLHTDFNSYYKDGIKLDRRVNLLIYMNPEWEKNIMVNYVFVLRNKTFV